MSSLSGAPRERQPSARSGREWLWVVLLSAAACTAAGEVEPNPVLIESAAGRAAGSGATSAPGQAPGGELASPAPVFDPGESDSPVRLLPGDTSEESATTTRAGAAGTAVVLDAGLDASAAGDAAGEGASERDAGRSPTDAGTPPAGGDASPSERAPEASPPADADASLPPGSAPCPGLLFEGSCYEFFDEQLTWSEAEERCIAWGGHLASVESSEEDAFIGAWPALLGVAPLDGSGLWLGGADAASDGDFRWWDDRPLSFAGWAPDQPNNGAGVDCIEKRNDATQRWYDRRCTDRRRHVCERPE